MLTNAKNNIVIIILLKTELNINLTMIQELHISDKWKMDYM